MERKENIMTKKEVLEIRKTMKPENCAITRIAGCYVDSDRNVISQFRKAFLSLDEEDAFKYFELFKKGLSGSIGKNLLNLRYKTKVHLQQQEQLLALRDSKLSDDDILQEFYEQVIENYQNTGNYYIVIAHGIYDIPKKTSDEQTLEDASEEVYDFIYCTICPVSLDKPGLSYNEKLNEMKNKTRDWMVETPANGFLFPAFSDRTSNIHEILYYTKKTEDIQPDFITNVLGTEIPRTYEEEKNIISELTEKPMDFGQMMDIKHVFAELKETDDTGTAEIGCKEIKRIYEKAGVTVDQDFDGTVNLSNLVGKKTKIKTGSCEIITESDESYDVVKKNGRKYLLIPIYDEISVDGIWTKAGTCDD